MKPQHRLVCFLSAAGAMLASLLGASTACARLSPLNRSSQEDANLLTTVCTFYDPSDGERKTREAMALLDQGADVDAMDRRGRTPLICAVKWCHRDLAKRLIERGARVNPEGGARARKDSSWATTPLLEAVSCAGPGVDPAGRANGKALVELLIRSGAVVRGQADLLWRAVHSTAEIMALLLQNGAVIQEDPRGGCSLLVEATSDPDMVALLIKAGASVSAKCNREVYDMDGVSPILRAARHGQAPLETFELLLRAGANVNDRARYGASPLSEAAAALRTDVVEYLLGKGADPNTMDDLGRTPLILVAGLSDPKGPNAQRFCQPSFEIAKRLANHPKTRMDVRDHEGRTALMVAGLNGSEDLVVLFLGKGADVSARDYAGSDALLLALGRQQDPLRRTGVPALLRNACSTCGSPIDLQLLDRRKELLKKAAASGNFEASVALLRELGLGPDVNLTGGQAGAGYWPFRVLLTLQWVAKVA